MISSDAVELSHKNHPVDIIILSSSQPLRIFLLTSHMFRVLGPDPDSLSHLLLALKCFSHIPKIVLVLFLPQMFESLKDKNSGDHSTRMGVLKNPTPALCVI